MSTCFHLVCHETRQQLWVGQGHGRDMSTLYMDRAGSDRGGYYARLHAFLRATVGKPLVLLSDHAMEDSVAETYQELDTLSPDLILETRPRTVEDFTEAACELLAGDPLKTEWAMHQETLAQLKTVLAPHLLNKLPDTDLRATPEPVFMGLRIVIKP